MPYAQSVIHRHMKNADNATDGLETAVLTCAVGVARTPITRTHTPTCQFTYVATRKAVMVPSKPPCSFRDAPETHCIGILHKHRLHADRSQTTAWNKFLKGVQKLCVCKKNMHVVSGITRQPHALNPTTDRPFGREQCTQCAQCGDRLHQKRHCARRIKCKIPLFRKLQHPCTQYGDDPQCRRLHLCARSPMLMHTLTLRER